MNIILHRTHVVVLFTLCSLMTACGDDTSDEPESGWREFDLRGGATLELLPETSLDEEELVDRNGYGATLTASDGETWFVHVGRPSADELEDLEPVTLGGVEPRVGELWLDPEAEDASGACVILVPIPDHDGHVIFTRPAEGQPCPLTAEDIEPWLPVVRATQDEDLGLRAAWGAVVGSFNGITAYSNGSTAYVGSEYSTCGIKWQCVEYVNRYYYQKLAHQNLKGTGNAKDYYSTAGSKGLAAYANTNAVPPAVGDMLTSAGGTWGHIAIVREVGANYVRVIHQNWANDSSDESKQLSMTYSGGKYTVSGFSGSYPVQGWLRRTGCTPTVSTVSPTTAGINVLTNFTVNGSCLPTTTTPWIANCANLSITSVTATQLRFSCRPSYATGAQAGQVKQGPDGTLLKSFTLTVY